MNKLIKFLISLKVFDPDSTLSLSNLMMMTLIFKVSTSPLDWTVLSALFLTLLNHNAKKVFRHKETIKQELSEQQGDQAERRIKELESSVKAHANILSARNLK